MEVVGGGSGEAATDWREGGLGELWGSRVLLWVSPTAGTSVLLCAPAGKAVRFGRRALLPRAVGDRGWGDRPVGRGPVGFRRGVLLHLVFPSSPEGPAAERICRDRGRETCHTAAQIEHVGL